MRVCSGQCLATWLVECPGILKTLTAIFSDTVNVMNTKVTMAIFQGHNSVRTILSDDSVLIKLKLCMIVYYVD